MDAEAVERRLRGDLEALTERIGWDEQFAVDLYRALAGSRWLKGGDAVSLSWRRASDLVDELRRAAGRAPLELAQSGDEGAVSRAVVDEVRPLGWSLRPRDTSRHDNRHVPSPPSPPPSGAGPEEWERRARADADEELDRRR